MASTAAAARNRHGPEVFNVNDLVMAYLSTGSGIAGVQPNIMVPEARMAVRVANGYTSKCSHWDSRGWWRSA